MHDLDIGIWPGIGGGLGFFLGQVRSGQVRI